MSEHNTKENKELMECTPASSSENVKHHVPFKQLLLPASVLVIMLLISYFAGINLFRIQYNYAKENASDSIRENTYEAAFASSESRYHVKNDVALSIGEMHDMTQLEVLQVSDVEYEIMNGSDNDEGIISWLEVPGYGVYTVDLTIAEFIIDNEHHGILVRMPKPVLTNFRIDYANVKKLLFKNDILNDSISIGEDLAMKQLKSAYRDLSESLGSNQYFYQSAQRSAKQIITNLLTNLNPNVPDIHIEIEFM